MSNVQALEISNRESTFNAEQVNLIKNQIAKGATNDELQIFLYQCKRSGLDPFARQIYCIERKAKDKNGNYQKSMTTQISIDGARVIAERSGKYAGQQGPFWCGDDGVWKDVWLNKLPPKAARVGVLHSGFTEPLWAVALFSAYDQNNFIWNKMPELMLAKCAEMLALRKAFPQDLSGLYSAEEMGEAETLEPVKPAQTPVDPQEIAAANAQDAFNAKQAVTENALFEKKLDELINPKILTRHEEFIGMTWRQAAHFDPEYFCEYVGGLEAGQKKKKPDRWTETNLAFYNYALEYGQECFAEKAAE